MTEIWLTTAGQGAYHGRRMSLPRPMRHAYHGRSKRISAVFRPANDGLQDSLSIFLCIVMIINVLLRVDYQKFLPTFA